MSNQAWLRGGDKRPFFSVIVCTYNRAHLLPRALDSILAQTESDFEVLVVDDGSRDHTQSIVQPYLNQSDAIRYFMRSHNRGLAAARNIGMKLSHGMFLTFLDSDDEYAVDHLAVRKQVLLKHNHLRVVHGGIRVIGNPKVPDRNDQNRDIHLDQCVVGGTFVIERSVISEVGGFDEVQYAEDACWMDKVVRAGIETLKLDHSGYIYYRNTPGQITSVNSSDRTCQTFGVGAE